MSAQSDNSRSEPAPPPHARHLTSLVVSGVWSGKQRSFQAHHHLRTPGSAPHCALTAHINTTAVKDRSINPYWAEGGICLGPLRAVFPAPPSLARPLCCVRGTQDSLFSFRIRTYGHMVGMVGMYLRYGATGYGAHYSPAGRHVASVERLLACKPLGPAGECY